MKTDFLGLSLKNPVIVAAGPWNRDGERIRNAIKAGAGAVITETILSDSRTDARPKLAFDGYGVQNIRLYSDIQVEAWKKEMVIAKSEGGVVIASVSAHTPSELAYIAAKMESFGADAIELGISSPMGEFMEVIASDADKVYQMTKEVVANVNIPVMVKLSQNTTNIAKVAKAVKRAGGTGVSAINTIRCILKVDIDKAEPVLSTYGGYSGSPIRPLGLAAVATVAQSVDIPICGVGGVGNYYNALEYIMLGASAVQMGTAVMLGGTKKITEVVEELTKWGDDHGIDHVNQIKGKALQKLKSFEEIKAEPLVCHVRDSQCSKKCTACEDACLYGAIEKRDNDIICIKSSCTGCGLCTFVCSDSKIYLDW